MLLRALEGDGVGAPVKAGTHRMTWTVTDDYPNFNSTAFTVKMTKIVDKIIRENPTQWLWFQKRWNTTPDMATKRTKHHTVGDKRLRRKAAANEAAKKAAEAEKKEEQPAK